MINAHQALFESDKAVQSRIDRRETWVMEYCKNVIDPKIRQACGQGKYFIEIYENSISEDYLEALVSEITKHGFKVLPNGPILRNKKISWEKDPEDAVDGTKKTSVFQRRTPKWN